MRLDDQTIVSLLERRAAKSPHAAAQFVRDTSGDWLATTWHDYHKTVRTIAHRIMKMGLKPGQHVAIMAPTSQVWDFLQMSVLAAGGVVVGLDPHDLPENINSIATCARLDALVLQGKGDLSKFSRNVLNHIQFVIVIDETEIGNDGYVIVPYQHLLKDTPNISEPVFTPDKNSPATIIFTSGTTGEPKGILYTHSQVVQACSAITQAYGTLDEGSRLVCWLPLSNLFQRMINFCAIVIGAKTYYVEDPRNILTYLAEISPHVFVAVPRFYEKLYEGILAHVKKKSYLGQIIFGNAVKLGAFHAKMLRQNKRPTLLCRLMYNMADHLALRNVRKVLGTDLQYMISGSAPMPKWLLEWFHSVGLLILEAYGTSENIIPNSANRPDDFKFGSVGKILDGNEIKLADDGEVMVRGNGVFTGYYHGEKTEAPLSADGFLATGDYAVLDEAGFLTLIGRKSDIIKTSTGRRIAPSSIEDRIKRIPYVEHVVVFGSGRKFLTAILSISTPKFQFPVQGEASHENIHATSLNEKMLIAIQKDVSALIASLPIYKRPSGILVTTRSFTVEGKELTSNLKVKRQSIVNKYIDELNTLYNEIESQAADEIDGSSLFIREL